MTDAIIKKRLPLAADTEPTDEELAEVMREARDLALARKVESDAWMRAEMAKAVENARIRDAA